MPTPPPSIPRDAWEAHFLNQATLVFPHGKSAPPLLLVQTASLPSGDGDRSVFTELFAYHQAPDRFVQVYARDVGHNQDEEVRYIASGPLKGSVISEEPTENAPFGFWVTVDRLTSAYTYKRVLRYRSATHYNDGNPLAVIDSEMPNIELKLGLWRPGFPLPLPAGPCPKPRLIRTALWCK